MWETKVKEILLRDNFTCQSCKQFDPSLGLVEIANEKNGDIELHEYNRYGNYNDTYIYSSRLENFTIEMHFGFGGLNFPILQVHHKRYIAGRKSWDYVNDDLITLCKQCHTALHTVQPISFYDKVGNLIESKILYPTDSKVSRHNLKPWTFIQPVGDVKNYADIYPKIFYITFDYESPERMEKKAHKMMEDFINRYLPDYAKKK